MAARAARVRFAVLAAVVACLAAYELVSPPAAYAGSTLVVRQNADGTYSMRVIYEIFVLTCVNGFAQVNGQHVQAAGTQVADPQNIAQLPPQVPCDAVRDVTAVGTAKDDLFVMVMMGFSRRQAYADILASQGIDTVEIDDRAWIGPLPFSLVLHQGLDPSGANVPAVRLGASSPFMRGLGTAAQTTPGLRLPKLVLRFGNGGATLNAAAYPSAVTAVGGSGRDRLVGGRAADRRSGGPGADTLIGGAGNDVFDGGPGRDVANGGPGRDSARRVEVRRGIP